jgi:hypothetical protein
MQIFGAIALTLTGKLLNSVVEWAYRAQILLQTYCPGKENWVFLINLGNNCDFTKVTS